MVAMKNATENAEELIERPDPGLQQGPPGQHHPRDDRDRVRRRRPARTRDRARHEEAPQTMATAAPTADRPGHPDHRPRRRHRVPGRPAAGDLQRGRDPARGRGRRSSARSSSTSATTGSGSVAMTTTDGLARGTARPRHRRPDHRAGRRGDPRPRLRRPRQRRSTTRARSTASKTLPIHRSAPAVRRADDRGRGLRDRPQGHRPDLPVQEGRQDRHLRRRRRRQDGHHPGADPQRRPGARRRVGVRRRRRAQPRGQRPHPRDDRVGRHREDGVRLRPDERAARRPPAGRPDRPDDGRVLPRRGGPRRPPVHRQHLPVHPGGLRGVGAARPDAVGGRLPAEPRDRDGRAPGADHLDQEGLDHVAPGRVRARPTTTPTRPRRRRSPTSTRRSASSARSPSSASTRPSTR